MEKAQLIFHRLLRVLQAKVDLPLIAQFSPKFSQ
jgi:hypothetical protein